MHRLDPDELADALIASRPEATRLLSEDESTLYTRLLHETSRHIIHIANNIDGYESAFGSAVLFNQQQIWENLELLLSNRNE
jgi:hypothetical protein